MKLMKEIVTASSRIAEIGTEMKSLKSVASHLIVNQCFKLTVNERAVFKRFEAQVKSFEMMRNAEEKSSGVPYKYTKVEKLLKNMKAQMESVEELKREGEEREGSQWKRKKRNTRLI